jgi:N-acyl-D-amino-acid deacylase
MEYDLIIVNGNVVDGSGRPSYFDDIAIKDGKIIKIGDVNLLKAKHSIDAKGFVVAPGFIDTHSHNDGYIFVDDSAFYKLSQGVTTEISGNCGEGLAPVSQKYLSEIRDYYEPYFCPEDLIQFTDHTKFFEKIDRLKLGINVGYYCAHGTLRMCVMGFEERKPTADEMQSMKKYLRIAMENGALGMSTGLVYSPGCFAETEEIIELCKVVKEYGGVYASHIRNESNGLIDAVQEAITIAEKSGVLTIISHLKAMGKRNWGKTELILEMIHKANERRVNIAFDQYPYTMSCTVLYWVIPTKYLEGGVTKLVERLKDEKIREEIRNMYFNPIEEWDNPMENIGLEGIHILMAKNVPEADGKTLIEYAQKKGLDPIDALFDIIIASGGNNLAAYDCMCDADVNLLMKDENGSIASDGIPVPIGEFTHPRVSGTFARVLGKYVREDKILSLENAIRKMTYLPASKTGLLGKGLIKEGYDADITIFNANTILDQSTLEKPLAKAIGIEYVIVNGQIAYENGAYTGASSGKRLVREEKI